MRRGIGMMGTSGRTIAAALVFGVLAAAVLAPPPARAQFFWDQPHYSAEDIAGIVAGRGFRLVARPFRNGGVFMADVVDQRGRPERLIVSGDTGEILQRFAVDDRSRYRRYADPSIPRGPMPPGRIPNEDDQPNVFSRLFSSGNDDDQPAVNRDIPVPVQPRPSRPRRSRTAEQSPETIRRTPIESAPLSPPSSPSPVRSAPATQPAPAQASLPPAAAPAPASPVDKPTRAIARDPLAIPGTREQDAAKAPPPAPSAAPAVAKPAVPPKPAVPVAPLE